MNGCTILQIHFLLSQAREISVKFEQVFKLFAAFHFVYYSADYLNDGKIDKLGK